MKLSVIIPVFNEGSSVRIACSSVVDVLKTQLQEYEYEVIFVDDGSCDDSFTYLTMLPQEYGAVRVIKFMNNCGSHMAIRAGLEHATGDVACFLSCDLQEPPELIPAMLDRLQDPVQLVWAVRGTRHDSLPSRLLAKGFYALARFFVSRNIPPSGASMFMLGPKALRAVCLYRERNLTLEGLFATFGFKQAFLSYDRHARQTGNSKWTLKKRLKLFADFFVAYSYSPIRVISYFGMTVAALGFCYALLIIFNKIFLSNPVEGWSSLTVAVLVIGGMQMIMLGVIGEYVWRTLDESRMRPRYIVEYDSNASQKTEIC